MLLQNCGGAAARSSRCGRRGVRDIEVVAELTRGGQCAKP